MKVVLLATDAKSMPDPLNEVRMLKELQGRRNIVELVDSFVLMNSEELLLAIVMEYATPLEYVLEKYDSRSKDVSESHLAILLLESAEGLEYIHQMGYIHRDIKVENMLVSFTRDGKKSRDRASLKIADYGLSKKTRKTSGHFGTKFYVAPEITAAAKRRPAGMYSAKVDCYSWGVTGMIIADRGGSLVFEKEFTRRVDRKHVFRRVFASDSVVAKAIKMAIEDNPSDRASSAELNEV
jgi:serine/threonine protein kinase